MIDTTYDQREAKPAVCEQDRRWGLVSMRNGARRSSDEKGALLGGGPSSSIRRSSCCTASRVLVSDAVSARLDSMKLELVAAGLGRGLIKCCYKFDVASWGR